MSAISAPSWSSSSPCAMLKVSQSGDIILLTGSVPQAENAVAIHKFLDATKVKYVDMTTLAGVQQVHLQVRVAEVSRTAIRALGINAFMTGNSAFGGSTIGPDSGGAINPVNIGVPSGTSTTGQLPFQFTSPVGVTPPVTLFGGFNAANLEIFLQALAENQYLRLLAEPSLVAATGEEANVLVGGEYPIPVVQNAGAGSAPTISIEYKEYGVRLKFKPTVLGDGRIRLLVAPEVSELTDVGAVVIQGFSVPALLTRRAQTTLEMHSGQTFGMAGLINHTVDARSSKTPGLGDLPGLGAVPVRAVRPRRDRPGCARHGEPGGTDLRRRHAPAARNHAPGPQRLGALRPGAGRSQHARPDFAGSMQVAQAIGPEPAARSRRVGPLRSRGHRRDL